MKIFHQQYILVPLLLFLTIYIKPSSAQDTLNIMHYNLLHYGNYTSYCTNTNNNIDLKDEYLKTILNYSKPDVFTVNEMSSSVSVQERMLNNNLNTGGIGHYRMSNNINQAGTYIVNQLYYNSNKLALKSHKVAQDYIRDIDVYKLYYRSNDLHIGDTVFIVCIVAHLKSGNSSENAEKRRQMVDNTLNFLSDNHSTIANYLFMGDFNTYKSSEPCYQLLINNPTSPVPFFDPIDTPGNWNNNYDYRYVHTQSTHASGNGCASSGGMDDRFDFILTDGNILSGTNDIEFIEGSYIAIGQDGKHFNNSINNPPANNSAPEDVIEALYENSDHLPVSIKLKVNKTLDIRDNFLLIENITFANPNNGSFALKYYSKEKTVTTLSILDISGNVAYTHKNNSQIGYNTHKVEAFLANGIYILKLINDAGGSYSKKMVIIDN